MDVLYQYIETPLFVLENQYDEEQVRHVQHLKERCHGRPCHCLLALGSGLALVGTASSRR